MLRRQSIVFCNSIEYMQEDVKYLTVFTFELSDI